VLKVYMRSASRNPFQGGMGFFTQECGLICLHWANTPSQSLSGWDGVFHRDTGRGGRPRSDSGRNPFQGGMGFFTCAIPAIDQGPRSMSQSLSGWDGVFHKSSFSSPSIWRRLSSRNPFQGGMGFFTRSTSIPFLILSSIVAIPFRVGWGFSPIGTKSGMR